MNERYKRILMTISGVLVCGFSVGMFNFSSFGMDPFQVLAHGIGKHIQLGYGAFYAVLNLIMLIFVFIFDKRKIGLGTLINIFLSGYMVQFSSWLFLTYISAPSLWLKIIFLIVAVIIMCFGSALYFTGDLGVSTYDAAALILSEKKVARFQYCRICTDLLCVICGCLLGATAGIGTVITAFFMGPLIAFFNRKIAMPLRYGKINFNHKISQFSSGWSCNVNSK